LLFSQEDCIHLRRRIVQECIDFAKFDSNRVPIENVTVFQNDVDIDTEF
jgi:hypothetical protein